MACDPVKIEAAKDAYHRLMTGKMARVVIDQNGERVEYQKANLTALADLIRKMKMELAACGLLSNRSSYQPLRVYF